MGYSPLSFYNTNTFPFVPSVNQGYMISRLHFHIYNSLFLAIADVSEKTISEEYTPLHLAARFNPSCHSVDEQCDQSSSEAQNAAGGVEESHDGQESSTHPPSFKRQTSIEQVLKFLMEKQNDSVRWEHQLIVLC